MANGRTGPVLRELRLTNFKNFRQATLSLGPLTVLVGTNASGKSNLRDAFRFLHGQLGRGYNSAETIGGVYGDGGQLVWSGIRGGIRELSFLGSDEAELALVLDDLVGYRPDRLFQCRIVVKPSSLSTSLGIGLCDDIAEDPVAMPGKEPSLSKSVGKQLASMRFFDFLADHMREPSVPGQTVLGDQGQNLSSVLHAMCADSRSKAVLLDWIGALTPMDAVDLEFPADPAGRVLLVLVERDGKRISAYSASDGTLKFLAMLAALLGPTPPRFCFFEELESGIHPVRLALLVDFIERRAADRGIQVVATTHSPQLLAFLGKESREHVSVVYRLPETSDARIRRVVDIPEVREVLETKSWARLHESGWFENAVHFTEPESAGAQ